MLEKKRTIKKPITASAIKKQSAFSTETIEKIYWANVNKNATLPTKRDEDGGYDLYICSDKKEYILEPGDIALLPTGLATAFPKEFVGLFRERGSTGSKCLSLRMGVLDSGYRNEIFIGINNTSNKTVVITNRIKDWEAKNVFYNIKHYTLYPIEKAIAQVVFVKKADMISNDKFISWDELKNMKSKRGLGALGSSKK